MNVLNTTVLSDHDLVLARVIDLVDEESQHEALGRPVTERLDLDW